ncbi:MAG: patatin-like phospholipase family protein [Elusimicrobiota bacterium]
MTPEEISLREPFLKRIPFFSGLSSEDIAFAAARLQPLSLPKGSALFRPGDAPDAFYVIASGQVRIAHDLGGAETTIAILGRGEMIGEGGLLTGEPRSTIVRLMTTCELLKMVRTDFEDMLRERPAVLLHISRVLARRLVPAIEPEKRRGKLSGQLVSFGAVLKDADAALFAVHLGIDLVEQSRREVVLLDMSERAGALARMLGLSPVLVDREMLLEASFRDPGLIRTMAQQHASGLKILSLPPGIFDDFRSQAVYLFLNVLREAHGFVLAFSGGNLGPAQEAAFSEADAVLLVGAQALRPQYRQLDARVSSLVDAKKISRFWIGDLESDQERLSADPVEVIPWSDEIAAAYARSGSPYAALGPFPKAKQALGRLARRLSGLRVGLALGSGAAFGFAHIGILKVFKREGIPIDAVSGSSMGSFLGGLFALGMEPEEMEELARNVDRGWVYENLLWDLTIPRSGFFGGQTLLRLLRSYFGSMEFADMEIPFACVATDIENGEEVVLREGRVAEAVRASCGIPIVFSPFRLDGRYLVDGGLVNPVPVSVLPSLGAEILIASEVIGPLAGAGSGRAPLGLPPLLKAPAMFKMFSQMFFTMEAWVARARIGFADVVMQPDLNGFSWTELDRARELIAVGERAAEQYLPQVKALIPFFSDSCRTPLRLSSPFKP